MGMDVSFLLAPIEIPDGAILDAAAKLEHTGSLQLLVGDATSAPEPLQAVLPKLTVISLWGDDPLGGGSWDELGLDLSRELETTLLAVSMSDHGGVGCWQLLEKGELGPAHWLEADYTEGVLYGLQAGFGIELNVDDAFFAENVCCGVTRGWVFPGPVGLRKKGIETALGGYSWPLEHPGEQIEASLPPATEGSEEERYRPESASEEDRHLVEALGTLTLKSPAKRMVVEDLQRKVAGGVALTDGQRQRAKAILDEFGWP